ncbi:ATP-binding protein [Sphaerisporangium fuscum]|uniref:ATP-binding protein n=1 Tax=Sphaerisporangium fuscum TaxID=2835868 RepID=UPI001BDDADDA|nr:ATP-binding protein [Sphaerisporangium fuscum]
MTDDERRALEALRFNYTEGPGDVWRPSEVHVDGLNRRTAQMILDGLSEVGDSVEASPLGLVLQGQRGTGKTHLLGWVRERVQEDGGYFFLVGLLDARDFWQSVLVSMLDSLARQVDGESQLRMFLLRLSSYVGVPRMVRRELVGKAPLTKAALDVFVEGLRRFDGRVGTEAQDTLRALVLRASDDLRAQDVGHTYLLSEPEEEPGERAAWGMRRRGKSAQEIVQDVSRLLAFTGPSVIAVDQFDPLVTQASISMMHNAELDWRQSLVLEQIAGGLMGLREYTSRTLTVLSCLPLTWVLIQKAATDTIRDRFREAVPLMTVPDSKIGRELVEKRFAARFRALGFRPPYPTWPVLPSAFDDAPDYTPRQLLMKVDAHIQSCRVNGRVTELGTLAGTAPVAGGDDGAVAPQRLDALDARFAALRDAAEVADALAPASEDAVVPVLLAAGLTAWIMERGEAGQALTLDPPPSSKPSLHARLRRTLDESIGDEAHWAFRAIAAENAVAALHRLRTACLAAGLDAEAPQRRLFLLRNAPWGSGPRTREALAAFERAGGRTLPVDEQDLKALAALRDLMADNPPDLRAWLVARRPTGEIKLLNEALADVWAGLAEGPEPTKEGTDGRIDAGSVPTIREAAASSRGRGAGGAGPSIVVGRAADGGGPVAVQLEALRKHTAVFAGSGSGKTVLLRRLVEECALQGVSAIVLDPNNDLARLGDRWPEELAQWAPGDAARAEEYLANTDVAVWTPLRDGGRPLSFQPLPDFGGVADDPDEFREAVDTAVASLAPRAKLVGTTNKVHQGLAVLRETLTYYGRRGHTSLRGLIEVLSSLPDGVSELLHAGRLAADIAQNLTAAMVNDPLLGGSGTAMDPGILLTPPEGRRARVSVVSLIGLQSDEQRQSFVNQLQMALFAWIKKHPAGDRPLGGLFVMDEAQTFAPSGAMTACTHSTLALASQARKYGLGLVFATQAPKGLHNRIPGNAATQFFGLLNSPIQISAAREMARVKGGDVPHIGRLGAGQFYAAVEGGPFERIQASLCLTHHPKSPLTTEEVIQRSRRTGR